MAASIQEKRKAALLALLTTDGTDPESFEEGNEEDLLPYLSGEEDIGRFCCVMYWSRSEGTLFYLPQFDTLQYAIDRAEYPDWSGNFSEVPVKIVDLDDDVHYYAQPVYAWNIKEPVLGS